MQRALPSVKVPLRSFLAYAAHPTRRAEIDHQAQRERLDRALAGALPRGLTLEWLGTSGFRLTMAGYTLLIDPYVTRLPLRHFLAATRPALPREDLVERYLPKADAICIGHAHFDHVLDAPEVARRTGARIYGSRSVTALCSLHGLESQAVEVTPNRPYELGPFQVTFVPSAHAKLLLGIKVPMAGDISCDHLDHLAARAYGCGQVFGIHIRVGDTTLYHLGSAELLEGEIADRRADVLLAAIAGRGFSDRFLTRAVRALQPSVVVPHHHDDFFRPLADDTKLSFNVNLCGAIDEVQAASRDIEVVTLPRLGGPPG